MAGKRGSSSGSDESMEGDAEPQGDVGTAAPTDFELTPEPPKKPRRGSKAAKPLPPEPPPEPAEVGEMLARAGELAQQGKADEALALYREAVAEHPGSVKAHLGLGLLYDTLGQHERAIEQLEAARDLDPDNLEALAGLAGALVDLNRFDEAERELRRALKIDDENVSVRAHLGILYFRRSQYQLADEELAWVCERDPQHAVAYFYRGEALNRLGRLDPALEVLEQAARLQPTNARIFQTMGIVLDKKHMPAEAARMYKKVRELSR